MFENNERVEKKSFGRSPKRFVAALALAKVALLAIFIQVPVYATDPIDVDPNPDFTHTHTITIVVERFEEVSLESLAPGYYVIVVIDENQTFEIFIQ